MAMIERDKIPDDIMERAREEARSFASWIDAGNTTGFLSAAAVDAMAGRVAQALLAERAAQREKDAGIAADFNWRLPLHGRTDLDEATDDAACAVQEQIAQAIRNQS